MSYGRCSDLRRETLVAELFGNPFNDAVQVLLMLDNIKRSDKMIMQRE
jgi:hypothetical protein